MSLKMTKQTQLQRLYLLSALLVKLLVKCSFAAEPENTSPWDVFIDPHFSFGLCCISPEQCVPFQRESHCHFSLWKHFPMQAFGRTDSETSQDLLTFALFKASKCLLKVSQYIQYVHMHLSACMRKYDNVA